MATNESYRTLAQSYISDTSPQQLNITMELPLKNPSGCMGRISDRMPKMTSQGTWSKPWNHKFLVKVTRPVQECSYGEFPVNFLVEFIVPLPNWFGCGCMACSAVVALTSVMQYIYLLMNNYVLILNETKSETFNALASMGARTVRPTYCEALVKLWGKRFMRN